jgi:hypothetical protein
MKNIIYFAFLLISIRLSSQCTYTVTATYTAPSCPTCCDGVIQGGVQGATCINATSTLQPSGISTANWQYTNLCSGSYTVVVSDGCACIGTCGVSLSGATTIEEFYEGNLIKVYPNPASGILYLSSQKYFDLDWEIQITDAFGQIILKLPYRNEIDVSQLSYGYYNLKIITKGKHQFHSKFIKE